MVPSAECTTITIERGPSTGATVGGFSRINQLSTQKKSVTIRLSMPITRVVQLCKKVSATFGPIVEVGNKVCFRRSPLSTHLGIHMQAGEKAADEVEVSSTTDPTRMN